MFTGHDNKQRMCINFKSFISVCTPKTICLPENISTFHRGIKYSTAIIISHRIVLDVLSHNICIYTACITVWSHKQASHRCDVDVDDDDDGRVQKRIVFTDSWYVFVCVCVCMCSFWWPSCLFYLIHPPTAEYIVYIASSNSILSDVIQCKFAFTHVMWLSMLQTTRMK